MQAKVKWRLELEAGKVWRVLPTGDRLGVGAGGGWRGSCAADLGLRDQLAACDTDDAGETDVIGGDRSVPVRLPRVAVLKMLGPRVLSLRA